ncbi:MAG TPA: hypothetical protein VFH95_06610 [Candidatus Kapabacteria bacterium]|nr:hypothetical protein [Candidatus Kapabacteria bacterium]
MQGFDWSNPTGGFIGPNVPAGWKPGDGGFDLTPTAETTDDTSDGPPSGLDVLALEAKIWQAQQDAKRNPTPTGPIKPVDQRRKPVDPCAGSSQVIKNSQIPPAPSDPNNQWWDPSASPYWGSPLFPQAQGLQAERQLAALASDYGYYAGVDLNTAFEKAVGTIGPSDTPEEIADKMMNSLLDQAGYLPADGVYPTGAVAPMPGTLSPALISVLDQIAQEIQDGNGGDIDWSAFADVLNAQASADAAALQAAYLSGHGKGPCGDINDAVNSATNNQRNNQRKANNALKKLDKNIKPPKLPPGPGGNSKGPVKEPVKTPNLFGGLKATTKNVPQSHLGPISPGLLHSGAEIYAKGPAVADRLKEILRPYGGLTLGQTGDSLAQAQGQAQIGQEDLSYGMAGTLTGDVNDTLQQYQQIIAQINIDDAGDPEKAASDYAGLCDATLQDLMPIYHHLEDIIKYSSDASAVAAAQSELASLIQWLNKLSYDYTMYDSLHQKSKWWP